MAVNAGILPVPLPASPIAVLLLTQAYVMPFGEPVKDIVEVLTLSQKNKSAGCATVGIGFIVILYVKLDPGQVTFPFVVAVAIY